jgi:hypothetical protein
MYCLRFQGSGFHKDERPTFNVELPTSNEGSPATDSVSNFRKLEARSDNLFES